MDGRADERTVIRGRSRNAEAMRSRQKHRKVVASDGEVKEKPLLGRAVQFFATKQTKLCAQNVHATRTSRVTRPRLVYDDKKD